MAYSFIKSSSQTISYPVSSIYDGFGGQLTITFWIKVGDWDQLSGIISKRSTASNTISYMVALDSFFNPKLYMTVGNGAGGVFCTYSVDATNFPIGEWVHIALTYNSARTPTNRIKIYMNGVEQATTPETESAPLIGNVNFQLYLGRDTEAGTQYLDGNLAEIGIWARSLSLNQISALSRGFKPNLIDSPNLRFYASLLANQTHDQQNYIRSNTTSSTPIFDHAPLFNRITPFSFFPGGNDQFLTSYIDLNSSLEAVALMQDELPSYAGHQCMIVYINRSEEFEQFISRRAEMSL